MDIVHHVILFFLGAIGALLTIYLSKNSVIPEFRSLSEVNSAKQEKSRYMKKIKKTEKEIDEIQEELKNNYKTNKNLNLRLNSSQKELENDRRRVKYLEKDIKHNDYFTRGMGFIMYCFFGGVFAALLSDYITISNTDAIVLDGAKALIIGATWTSYLSTIGFKSYKEEISQGITSITKENSDKLDELKDDFMKRINNLEKADMNADMKKIVIPNFKDHIEMEFRMAKKEMNEDMEESRMMLQHNLL